MATRKPEIEVLERRLKTLKKTAGFFSILSFALATLDALREILAWFPWREWLRFWLPWQGWLITGIALSILTWIISGYRAVQTPERWIIERFGKKARVLKPGLQWIIPMIETVRGKPRVWEQSLELFASQPKIDFRDGSATLKNPRIYVQLSKEDDITNAIYNVASWKRWIVNTAEPIIRGYLNTLSIREALDEGAARGDIIKRLKERPRTTKNQAEAIKKMIEAIDEQIKELKDNKKDIKSLEVEKVLLEGTKKELESREKDQKRLRKAFNRFRREAKDRGIEEIHRVVVAEFGLSKNVIAAREKVLEEERGAAAAIHEAIRETTLRTESIRRSKDEFVKMGFSEKDALRKAYELDLIETLAKSKSLFLTGGRLDLASIVATISGIIAEASQKSKKG